MFSPCSSLSTHPPKAMSSGCENHQKSNNRYRSKQYEVVAQGLASLNVKGRAELRSRHEITTECGHHFVLGLGLGLTTTLMQCVVEKTQQHSFKNLGKQSQAKA